MIKTFKLVCDILTIYENILKWALRRISNLKLLNKYLKIMINPTKSECRKINRYLRNGRKSTTWAIRAIRHLVIGGWLLSPYRLMTNKMYWDLMKIRYIQTTNTFILLIDYFFLAISSFLAGRMIEVWRAKPILDIEMVPEEPNIRTLIILTICAVILIYWTWSQVEIVNHTIIPNDAISRVTLNIPGPLTELELNQVDSYLSAQAWIDNLLISPIGDLWIDPW